MTGMISRSWVRTAAGHTTLALLAVACGLAFAPAFGGRLVPSDFAPGGIVTAVLVGAVVPAAVVCGGVLTRAKPMPTAASALVLSAVAILVATRAGARILSGAQRLLTAALPAAPDAPARGTVAVLVAFVSLLAAMIAGYSRRPVLAVLPALVCLLAALALDAGVGGPPVWLAAVVVALIGIALALLSTQADRPTGSAVVGGWRSASSVAAVVLVLAGAVVVTVAVSNALPAVRGHPAAVQNLVAAPVRPRAAVQPMTQYPAFANGVDKVRLRGTSSARLPEMPMVTLSSFTGQSWTTTTRYRRASETLQNPTPAHPVTVSVTAVAPQDLSWLVRPDRPSKIDRSGLGVDPGSGDLVVPAGADYPTRYRVVGSALVLATVAESDDPPAPLSGPVATDPRPAPAVVREFAAGARPAGSGYLQLITLQNRLRSGAFRVATGPSAPTGCGYVQLATLLDPSGPHIGTSQQFASAFAVAARLLGYDARVVLGFRPRYAKDGHSFTITGPDIHAWAQVRFVHAGWVSFDPTPTQHTESEPRPQPAGPAANLSGGAAPSPSAKPARSPSAPHTAVRSNGSPISAGAVVLLLVLVALLALAIPPVAKAVRRRRRLRADVPGRRVYGAWREVNDRLLEVGVPTRNGQSTADVTASAPRRVRHEVHSLGTLLDRAGYAPEVAEPDDAIDAWRQADRITTILRSRMSRGRRLAAALDPRPLLHR